MNIFVINSGSSSIKYQLISMPEERIICSGSVERIGLTDGEIKHKDFRTDTEQVQNFKIDIADHAAGLQQVATLLGSELAASIEVVGHRVVHGGESFSATVEITPEIKIQIEKLFPLAPLHNPPNLLGIQVAEKIFPTAKQVAVFDTAFHQTLPEKAYRYAIPESLYKEHGIRAYGFHGTSHKYVAQKAAAYLNKPEAKIITIHLGNGCSMAAIENGKCVDTTMGLGPMNGLMMGTRSGDIDQSVIFYLINQLGYTPEAVNTLLNKKSGMTGLTGLSDMRDIRAEILKGNKAAQLAYDMYTYRIRKFIGAYVAAMNGVDALVFTAGVGENDSLVRKEASSHLEYLGIKLDQAKNLADGKGIRAIQQDDAPVKILIIPTNEELEIAAQCYALLKK
ncbi:MAG: acetate/propionate family kinase [Ferruginibacter sp.]